MVSLMTVRVFRQAIGLSAERMFDLALDVERYPQFVPWWEAARIIQRRPGLYRTDQIVGFKLIRQRFISETSFERPLRIDVRASGGVLRHFELHWRFLPRGDNDSDVELTFDLHLGPAPLQRLADGIAHDAVSTMLAAFEREASRLAQTSVVQ